ncbi:MAG: hypothetical protein ACJ74Q_24880 [Pyrinomonadaceae bacterium]
MKTRKMSLPVFALALLALLATACNKAASSANTNAGSSSAQNSSASPGTSSTVSKRFVGTWVEEDQKSDQGSKFTEDGKIIELSSNKTVGTYVTSGDDKATITIAEGGAGTATLESDTRMKMVVGGETVYLKKK